MGREGSYEVELKSVDHSDGEVNFTGDVDWLAGKICARFGGVRDWPASK